MSEIKKYVVVKNNIVDNIIVCEEGTTGNNLICFDDLPHPYITMGWRLEKGKWNPPPRDIEFEWQEIRNTRDQLLSDSDVYVLPDRWASMTTEKQQEWSTYRQTLRDIPETFADPKDVVWPAKPK